MSAAYRRIIAVIVALVVAIVIIRLLEELAQQVTMPAGVDYRTALERGELPFASFALVLCGWWLAAYTGSRIAAGIGRARASSLVFALAFTLVIVRELMLVPHPTWMWIGGALGVPLLALGATGESITIRGA
jgi:hypothetical protein